MNATGPRPHLTGARVGVVLATVLLAVLAYVAGPVAAASPRPANPSTVTDPTDGTVISGATKAPVAFEEFGDFQCPACRRFHQVFDPTLKRLIADQTLRFVFHPIDSIDGPTDTESLRSASASLCASDAGRFWAFHDLLYDEQSPTEDSGYLTDQRLVAFGQRAGMTGDALSGFEACVHAQTYTAAVKADFVAWQQRGLDSTPTLVINGLILPVSSYSNQSGTDFDRARLLAVINMAAKHRSHATSGNGSKTPLQCQINRSCPLR